MHQKSLEQFVTVIVTDGVHTTMQLASAVYFALLEGAGEDPQLEGTSRFIHLSQHRAPFKEQRLLGIHNHVVKVTSPRPLLSIFTLITTQAIITDVSYCFLQVMSLRRS